MAIMSEIDFVVPWVDGGDPIWIGRKSRYVAANPGGNHASRYRDWGIFQYWFRSVEAHAPWVRRIYLITDRQIPSFLQTEHPKLRIVFHDQYIPAEYLPTFNANTIELNLHRIPDLSETFVYFNDDFFLNRPLKPEDFFRKGKPCYAWIERPIVPCAPINMIQSIVLQDMGVINRHFTRNSIRKHPGLYFNRRYGKHALKNLLLLPWRHFQHFEDDHMPCPFLKSTLSDVWKQEEDILDATCRHRFRTADDVNQYLFRYWDLARGNFSPIYRAPGYYLLRQDILQDCVNDILQGKHAMLCLNDNSALASIDSLAQTLQEAFQTRYPRPSAFEKTGLSGV